MGFNRSALVAALLLTYLGMKESGCSGANTTAEFFNGLPGSRRRRWPGQIRNYA
jgi:hypothetical protein